MSSQPIETVELPEMIDQLKINEEKTDGNFKLSDIDVLEFKDVKLTTPEIKDDKKSKRFVKPVQIEKKEDGKVQDRDISKPQVVIVGDEAEKALDPELLKCMPTNMLELNYWYQLTPAYYNEVLLESRFKYNKPEYLAHFDAVNLGLKDTNVTKEQLSGLVERWSAMMLDMLHDIAECKYFLDDLIKFQYTMTLTKWKLTLKYPVEKVFEIEIQEKDQKAIEEIRLKLLKLLTILEEQDTIVKRWIQRVNRRGKKLGFIPKTKQ